MRTNLQLIFMAHIIIQISWSRKDIWA